MASYLALGTDHTHIIFTGSNDLSGFLQAASRYSIGEDGYVDPVAFDNVFEFVNGFPSLTVWPVVRVRGPTCQ